MTDEEKEAIEIMLKDMFFWQGKSSFITRHRYKELSKKMFKEIDKLQKVIDLMAFEIAENTGSCPLDIYDWENKKYDNCNNCNDTYKECFIEYFYKKVEEENDS